MTSTTDELDPTTLVEDHGEHADPRYHLAHHFDTPQQQFDSGKFGIWLFLVTEILFFSGLFCAYAIVRGMHPEIFAYASKTLDTKWGAINTVVLIVSSVTAAWAVRNAQMNQQRWLKINIVLTLLCASAFMCIKYVEYSHKFHVGLMPGYAHVFDPSGPEGVEAGLADEPRPENLHLFYACYFGMTGLHGIHVLAGMVVWIWMLVRAFKGQFGPKFFGPIDFSALYWHIVDLIWIYLFPLLYLIN
jgi:cytochrome c oxidase subunit 3